MPLATQPPTEAAVKTTQRSGSPEPATTAQDVALRKKKRLPSEWDAPLAAGGKLIAFIGATDSSLESIEQEIQGLKWPDIDRMVEVLNEIAQIHPFIQVTVATFTGIINFVRDIIKNDQRLELLVYAMCDMMQCFTNLKRFRASVPASANVAAAVQSSIPAHVSPPTSLVTSTPDPASQYRSPTANVHQRWQARVLSVQHKLRNLFPRQTGKGKLESTSKSTTPSPKLDSSTRKADVLAQKVVDMNQQVAYAEGSVGTPAKVEGQVIVSPVMNGLDKKEALSHGLSNQLSSRLDGILLDIKRCVVVCKTYQNEDLLWRVVKVYRWKAVFEDTMNRFKVHKEKIQLDLHITVANSVEDVRDLLTLMSERFLCGSHREAAVYSAFQDAGGPGGQDKYEKGVRMMVANDAAFEKLRSQLPGPIIGPLPSRTEFTTRLDMDVETLLKANISIQKQIAHLDAQIRSSMGEIASVTNQTYALVTALASEGAHTRVIDKDVQKIWKYMDWKGTVTSRKLVLALRDYFVERTHPVILHTENGPTAVLATEDQVSETEMNDTWVLRYITVTRMQSLLEAVDDDYSSFVTISEINKFTQSKPTDWSLPLWMAYWAYGFELSSASYFHRIRVTLYQLWQVSRKVHPLNRNIVSFFIQCNAIELMENILSGFTGIDQPNTADIWDPRVDIFDEYTNGLETTMENILRDEFHYQLDGDALALILKGDRPEKHFLPIIFILMKQSVRIALKAQESALGSSDLNVIGESLEAVFVVANKRARELQAHWKLNSLDEPLQLDRFFFGLYSRLNRDPQHGSYWSLDTADLQRSEFIVQDTPTPGESSAAPADSNSEPHRDTVQGDPEEEDAEAVRRRSFFHWILCEICKDTIPDGRRHICVECSQARVNDTLDFCHACYRHREIEALDLDRYLDHQLSHTILELRTPLPRSFQQSTGAKALSEVNRLLGWSMDETGLQPSGLQTCKECSETITTVPYWNCVDCRDSWTFICQACNDKFDYESSRRRDDAPTPEDDEHRWWHTLACVQPKSGAGRLPTMLTSLEKRMKALEKQLKEEQSAAAKGRADATAHYALMSDLLKKFAPAEVVSDLNEVTAVIPPTVSEVVTTDVPDVSLLKEGNADNKAETLVTDTE